MLNLLLNYDQTTDQGSLSWVVRWWHDRWKSHPYLVDRQVLCITLFIFAPSLWFILLLAGWPPICTNWKRWGNLGKNRRFDGKSARVVLFLENCIGWTSVLGPDWHLSGLSGHLLSVVLNISHLLLLQLTGEVVPSGKWSPCLCVWFNVAAKSIIPYSVPFCR